MTYQVNPDGTVTMLNTKEQRAKAAAERDSWADYVKDLNNGNADN